MTLFILNWVQVRAAVGPSHEGEYGDQEGMRPSKQGTLSAYSHLLAPGHRLSTVTDERVLTAARHLLVS